MSRTVHGGYGSTEYVAYRNMLQRCLNPRHPRFHQYGARGVTVCERWRESFQNFLADMGRKTYPDLTLDRTDPTGNYEPENCRWISFDENRRNRRKGGYRITDAERHRRSVMAREYVHIREAKRLLGQTEYRKAA